MNIPIAIVDDSTQHRFLLEEQINYATDIKVCLTADNGKEFLSAMDCLPEDRHPAVVLMDIEMPEINGIDTVRLARERYPDMKFLMLTVFDDDEKIFEAIRN